VAVLIHARLISVEVDEVSYECWTPDEPHVTIRIPIADANGYVTDGVADRFVTDRVVARVWRLHADSAEWPKDVMIAS
jgi:hypothetical protein